MKFVKCPIDGLAKISKCIRCDRLNGFNKTKSLLYCKANYKQFKGRLYIFGKSGRWIAYPPIPFFQNEILLRKYRQWLDRVEPNPNPFQYIWEGTVKDWNLKKEKEYDDWLRESQQHTYDVLGNGVALNEVRCLFDQLGIGFESKPIGLKEFFNRMDMIEMRSYVFCCEIDYYRKTSDELPSNYDRFFVVKNRNGTFTYLKKKVVKVKKTIDECMACRYFSGHTEHSIRCDCGLHIKYLKINSIH